VPTGRHSRPARARDPFAALGLAARPDLSDDDVRAAWRRIAAATHPDRGDGGDPARYGAAAAAYAVLRTGYGRGEAFADLEYGVRRGTRGVVPGVHRGRARGQDGRGRLAVLALRIGVAAAVSAISFAVAGWAPASIGVLAGAVTWLAATSRHDLPRGRGSA
jgi:curved DNA-binding protein CbpA